MSGVEIAGLVLGAFPILLNRLDYYRDGFEPLEEWWNFRTHFIAFVDDVNHQMMRYHQNMTRLLDPIITDNDGLIALVQNANDPRWKDGSLVIAMKERLASEYARFFRIIKRMEEVVASLKRLLQMKDNHVHWIESRGQKPWEWHFNRIRISFSKGKNKKVKKLGTYNQELQDILGFSERIIPLAEKRKLSRPVTRLEKLRQHACNLHNALGRHLRCSRPSCRSHQVHLSVRIELQEDMNAFFIIQGDDEHPKPLKREINISPPDDLTVSSSRVTTPISDVQQGKDFTAMQERFQDEGTTQKGLGLRGLFSKTSKNTPPVSTSANGDADVRKENGKQVRFATATPTVTVSQETQSPYASTSWEDKCHASGRTADLCSTLRDGGVYQLGSIADEFDRRFTLWIPGDGRPGVGAPDNARFVPLPQLLDAYNQANIDIARHRRFEMAANIASALLQIQMSPWVATKWSKHDFFFLADSEGLYTYHPYVFQTFPSKAKNTPTSPACFPDALHPNSSEEDIRASLFTIGVIILELIFGHNIESCSFRHHYYGVNNRPNDQTDISTARRWAQKVLGECGPEVSDVVRRCLDCSFGPRPSFSDKRFKEAVYEGVIGPLANYLKTWQAVMP